ncbi:MAG: hypothetical protein KC912_09565 [Proteobacteria bacterium]|nr:hypothetical protein [Pseudomonadota bacterium]
MLVLILLIASAAADTWTTNVGSVLSSASQLAWLEVEDEGQLRVTRVVRGPAPTGDVLRVWSEAEKGARVLLACGHPYANVCVHAVERDGLFWLEQAGHSFGSGSIHPGVSTAAHLDALVAGRAPLGLCVRIGAQAVVVDPSTGAAGLQGPDPVGFTAGVGRGRIDHFDPVAPVYVGRAGHTTYVGTDARLVEQCVVFTPLQER